MKPRIIVHHHTGLGDHFICNGLIHSLLEHYSIDLICKRHYNKTVKHLYEDFEDVNVVPVDNEADDVLKYSQETNYPLMRVGFEKCDYDNFEESFYMTSGVDPDAEYDKFILPKRLDESWKWYANLKSKLGEDYIFVHDASTYGNFDLKIESNLPRHTAVKEDTDDVLDYVDAICFAKEVHVINSGINNLVFQLYYKNMTKGKIFYHNARKLDLGGIPVKVPEGITVVEYE
jgi:hypothetical protein